MNPGCASNKQQPVRAATTWAARALWTGMSVPDGHHALFKCSLSSVRVPRTMDGQGLAQRQKLVGLPCSQPACSSEGRGAERAMSYALTPELLIALQALGVEINKRVRSCSAQSYAGVSPE